MTNYQSQIYKDLKEGAILQSSEGENYKTWLIYLNGVEKRIRRDSAEKVCEEKESSLIFGHKKGIVHWRFKGLLY